MFLYKNYVYGMQWRTPIGTRLTQYVKRMYILTSESKTHITVGQYSLVTKWALATRETHKTIFTKIHFSCISWNCSCIHGWSSPQKKDHKIRVLLCLLVSCGIYSFGELLSKRMHKCKYWECLVSIWKSSFPSVILTSLSSKNWQINVTLQENWFDHQHT